MSNPQMDLPPILDPTKAVLPESQALGMVSQADRPMMSQAQYMASLFLPGAVAHFQFFTDLSIILLGWLSASVEVFVRYDFGERYLSNIRLMLATMMVLFIGTGGAIIGVIRRSDDVNTSGMGGGWVFALFFIAYLALCLYHRWCIRRRNARGIQWHSLSFGTPWLALIAPWNDWTLYIIVEPLVVTVVGLLLTWAGTSAVGLWWLLGGIALALKNQMVYTQNRDRILDLIDSRIEAGFFQHSLNGAPKQKTAGFSVVPFPPGQVKVIEQTVPEIIATVKATLAPTTPGMGTPMSAAPGDFSATLQGTLGGADGADEKKKEAA